LEGIRNVVMRPLPALCGRVRFVSGAALDSAGNPELVLDPAVLIQAVRGGREPPVQSAPTPRPHVLVIDDSLTTRMLEQSILEAAGYPVDLAVSGKEALQKASQTKYALFVVDVEMPEMDGFELLAAFRSDPELRAVPAIMVTSRASAEDRRRGVEAGARAYIVKSEFDEGRLLEVIQALVGEAVP
jgi:two-component system chemotaxis sensor kinase CheA